ncbi:type IV toxin-antitoxin system AbiEi family antitoxin [Microbacterium sp. VKM Ac-2923]|uniref:type IV toxin-antitoxin system AbiEi family antitoxin n=1 Tax=Microbacterium sp. VKM Ac-2923 TaxID=2929476 RepID=UPI001FB51D6B|nr:type IV toxin-antitoxin system AbiEi family antitoxin [Microbacterium sp. VKM Ac-2923]MCJ1707352.1 type IV toxin-antitoxin system AbiEi family antitoxin [Microbacterium sp. VKM Ac-2923]
MVSPFLFFADERLSLAELSAACLDGLLVPLGAGYMPADAAETPWMRARSLQPLLGERWAAVRSSAAWIHGAREEEPTAHHVQRAGATRVRARFDARIVYHDVRLAADDVQTIGGVSVSSPERTLVDLARSDDDIDAHLARTWAGVDPHVRTSAEAWISRHPRFPYVRRAATLLSGATDSRESEMSRQS